MISENRLRKIKAVAKTRQEGVVVFEDIQDPHNAAAVLRSAEGLGIQKVYFIFKNQEPFNPKKIGKATSSSANKWLDFEVFTSTEKCFARLKKQGFKIVATVLDEKAKALSKVNFKERKIALVFGNEHSGLSQVAIDKSDIHAYIPMQGFVQSFNISVTAAMCMYEMYRQREESRGKFALNKSEQSKLIRQWKSK